MTVDLEELRELLTLRLEKLAAEKKQIEEDLRHVEAVQRLTRQRMGEAWPKSIKRA